MICRRRLSASLLRLLSPFLLTGWDLQGGRAPGQPVLWVALKGKLQFALLWRDEPSSSRQVNHTSFSTTSPAPTPQPLGDLLLLQVLDASLFLFEPTETPPAEGGVFVHQARHSLFIGRKSFRAPPIQIRATPLICLLIFTIWILW